MNAPEFYIGQDAPAPSAQVQPQADDAYINSLLAEANQAQQVNNQPPAYSQTPQPQPPAQNGYGQYNGWSGQPQNQPVQTPAQGQDEWWTKPLYDPKSVDVSNVLTPEETRAYDKSLGVINKVVTEHVKRLEEASRQRLYELHQRNAQLSAVTAEAFDASLYAAHRDLDDLTSTDAWKSYLNTRVPMAGNEPVGAMLKRAYERQDFQAVTAIVQSYKDKHGGTTNVNGMPVPAAMQSMPNRGSPYNNTTPAYNPAVGSGEVLKASQLQQAARDFSRGRISITTYEAVAAKFAAASAQGRVDNNA